MATYGITIEEFEQMVELQAGKCAICGGPLIMGVKQGASVDHCHTTGEIRGVLCGPCNTGLGLFKEDANILQAAVKYLKGK